MILNQHKHCIGQCYKHDQNMKCPTYPDLLQWEVTILSLRHWSLGSLSTNHIDHYGYNGWHFHVQHLGFELSSMEPCLWVNKLPCLHVQRSFGGTELLQNKKKTIYHFAMWQPNPPSAFRHSLNHTLCLALPFLSFLMLSQSIVQGKKRGIQGSVWCSCW